MCVCDGFLLQQIILGLFIDPRLISMTMVDQLQLVLSLSNVIQTLDKKCWLLTHLSLYVSIYLSIFYCLCYSSLFFI